MVDTTTLSPTYVETRLIERALQRKLTIGTLSKKESEYARQLRDGTASTWYIGPEVNQGDFVLIYFPKGLADDKESTEQKYGLRFLYTAAAKSTVSSGESRWNQLVRLGSRVELDKPITLKSIRNHQTLKDWGLAKISFIHAGLQTDSVDSMLARALWGFILKDNPKVRDFLVKELRSEDDQVRWVDDEPTDVDLLDREILAWDFARRLRQFCKEYQGLSFLIHVDGPWGSGKSTLLRLLRKQFSSADGTCDKWLFIDFNAWRQSHVGPPW
jgi:hypothetical protein